MIVVFVSLRSHRKGEVLQRVLGQNLPALLNEATQQDGFFEVLKKGIINDSKLLDAVIDFLARWTSLDEASYCDLLADSAVSREAAVLLPTTVQLWKWIDCRLGGQLELCTHRHRPRPAWGPRLEKIAAEDLGSLFIVVQYMSRVEFRISYRYWNCYRYP